MKSIEEFIIAYLLRQIYFFTRITILIYFGKSIKKMSIYLRFRYRGRLSIGILEDDDIQICNGDMFENPQPVGQTISLAEAEILPPCEPKKFLALWNNFYSRAEKEGWNIPPDPLYFTKTQNSWNAHLRPIPRPSAYSGPVFFEGELGIVIGKHCAGVSEADAGEYIFGYTCVNDVTAKEILHRDPSFPQWTRAKGFDGFGIFGPGIATGIDPQQLVVCSILDGEVKQNYPVCDMVFPPNRLVSLISQDMSLVPGDVIACGTGLGACAMEDGQVIEISIDGVGRLCNRMNAPCEHSLDTARAKRHTVPG